MSVTRMGSSRVVWILLVISIFAQELAECKRDGGFQEMHRKLFLEMKKMSLKNSPTGYGNKEMSEDWVLRRAPAGPDPIHHNGQKPKKPQAP